jgi:hypothetical protein
MSSRIFNKRMALCAATAGKPARHGGAELAVALSAVLLCLALWCGSASASMKYVTSFGSFSSVQGVAVDSSGDVYVYDTNAASIFKFDAEGNPVNFSSTGTNAITGVVGFGYDEAELAVDDSSGPAKGDIYVAHAGSTIEIFSSAGTKLGELSEEAGVPWGEACGVAVDSSGAVLVGLYPEHIDKFVPSGNPVTNADYASSIGGANGLCNVGTDSLGNAYSITWSNGPVTRYEAAQFGSLSATGSNVDRAGNSMAVDPSNDQVYVDEGQRVAQFGPNGEPFEDPVGTFGSTGQGALRGSVGIGVSGVNHEVYVSDGQGHITVFANLTKPESTTLVASNVTGATAALHGMVNPDGYAITSCSFEYGTTAAYGHSLPCTGGIGAGETSVPADAEVTGLEHGTEYHFRIVATNANGTGVGADQTFKTVGPPQVSGLSVSHVTATEASVSAEVNPQGLATSYRVEYGPNESYGTRTPPVDLGAQDASGHRVTVELAGLAPDTAYHARLLATNALGSVGGSDGAFTTHAQVVSSCSNEALRTGLSQRLPDCRAYEQVSVTEKEGASISEGFHAEGTGLGGVREGGLIFRASRDGNEMYYVASNAVAGSPAGGQTYYQADRDSAGWLTTPLTPPNLLETTPLANNSGRFIVTADYRYVSEDLSCKILQTAEPLSSDTPAADISKEVRNLYRRNADGSYTLLTNVVPINPPREILSIQYTVLGVSPDCKKILFKSVYDFLPGGPREGEGLYEWDEGTLRAAGVLPEGNQPVEGVDGGLSNASESEWHKVSEDGSRVFFQARNNSFQRRLYMREGNGTSAARTVEVAASHTATPSDGGYFQAASSSGSRVFFQANAGLTPGNPHAETFCSTESGEGCDLYEYDVSSGDLTDLTVDTNPLDSAGAGSLGAIGVSEDGSYVYFAAKGQLTPSSEDPYENTQAQNESQREANVYLSHSGGLSFVGRINADPRRTAENQVNPESFYNDRLASPNSWAARVTPDGKELLFMSLSQTTGYDNTDALLGRPDAEAYLYSADTGRTVCVSCNPSGARPEYATVEGHVLTRPIVPLTNSAELTKVFKDQPRAMSEDGARVFFETTDQLSPLAKGQEYNVYEWEMSGSGSCTSSSRDYSETSGGCVYLLDSGLPDSQFALPASFVDASADGEDVFLRTVSKLLPQDEDHLADVYDVRVGGGFAEGRSGSSCEGEACQGLAAGTPTFATPSTASFSGPGNPTGSKAQGKHAVLTRSQRLAHALRTCARKKGQRKRKACKRRARKRYGAGAARKVAARTGDKQ